MHLNRRKFPIRRPLVSFEISNTAKYSITSTVLQIKHRLLHFANFNLHLQSYVSLNELKTWTLLKESVIAYIIQVSIHVRQLDKLLGSPESLLLSLIIIILPCTSVSVLRSAAQKKVLRFYV